MAAAKFRLANSKLFQQSIIYKMHNRLRKSLYCTNRTDDEENTKNLTGFASFNAQQNEFVKEELETEGKATETETFASLLRKSRFIDLGDPEGKQVIGSICHVVEDDLYIDFDWKFLTVCKKPLKNQHLYRKGAKVKLLVKDLEISTRFLGSKTESTLSEADCVLLGLSKE